ncbi:MAG TPA: hypothetical protein VGF25_11200 [Thermoleophilaceae bacterium]
MSVALAEPVALPAALGERAPTGLDGLRDANCEVALVGAALQELRAALGGETAGEAQRAGELLRRLAVGPDRGGAVARRRRVPEDRLGVAGGLRMVCEPRGLGAAARRLSERGEGRPVERHAPVRRNRVLHRHPRDLVAERDGVAVGLQHARGEAGLEQWELVGGERLEQPHLGAVGHDRHCLEQRAGAGLEAGRTRQHRVADGRRHPATVARGEYLGHVERVAAGPAMELGGVEVRGAGERRHRVDRQGPEREPGHGGAAQVPQGHPHGMGAVELLLPVRRDDERRQRRDPPGQQTQQVEGRLVGPVEILDHEHRRAPAAELLRQRRRERRRRGVLVGERRELAARVAGDVQEGAERPRGVEGVAAAPEQAGLRQAGAEGAQERRLADARLAGHEHEAPRGGGLQLGEVRGERVELGRALEQGGGGESHWADGPSGGAAAPMEDVRAGDCRG